MYETGFYFDRVAAAFVRGVHQVPELAYPSDPILQLDDPLECLSPQQLEAIVRFGLVNGLHLHRFKRTTNRPRVSAALALIRGMKPANLLDIGFGHGAFLWALVDTFPHLPVTATDRDETRVSVATAVSRGGVTSLTAVTEDLYGLSFSSASFDVVTILDVIEHLPQPLGALTEAVRVAQRCVIVSVPSHEVGVLPHRHIFRAGQLTELLEAAGAVKITVDAVDNHLIAIGRTRPAV
ncbi:MAG: class I SAM-dependent methyltransferase [Capsulimonadaceae bacterium]